MRSIQSRNRNLGIQNAQPSAKSIAHRVLDRSSMHALGCAATGYATRLGFALREALERFAATRVGTTRVTGGALCTVVPQRSWRCPSQHRLAAR